MARPGVQLGLRHRVAGRVLPGLADIEQIVLVGVADVEGAAQNRRLVGRERIVTTTLAIAALPVLVTAIV